MKVKFILFSIIWVILSPFIFASSTSKPTYVIITIDHCITIPDIIDAQIDGKDCGIKAIIDICDDYHVKPTFFVSPYDCELIGEDKVKEVVQYMANRGCDIQLHTHPAWAYDKERPDLYQYTLEEQIEIIRFGMDKIHEWTGRYPIAHRAGDYGADRNTLRALYKNGIKYDSSFFLQHPSCKLINMKLPVSDIGNAEGIIEIPVTSFELKETGVLFGYTLPPIKNIRKIDIDWANYKQMTSCINQLIDARINTITFFMHFHSFYKSNNYKSLKGAEIDLEDIKEFQEMLKWITSNPSLKIVTFKDFTQKFKEGEISSTSKDILPVYEQQLSLLQYIRKSFGINRDNVMSISISLLFTLLLISGVIFFISYRKKK